MNIKNFITVALVYIPTMIWAQEEFQPHGKVSGEVFGDYYYKISSAVDSLLEGPGEYQETSKEANAFALRRLYLGYQYYFSEKFSGRLLLEGTDGELIANGKRGVIVKYAYLEWKNIIPGSDLIIGGQSAPAFSTFIDKVWGYRCIERNIMDFRKLGNSNDFGISLSGKILQDGSLNYYLMIGNGRKQKPENDKYKKIYASVTAKLLEKKLLLDTYFDFEPTSDTSNIVSIKGFIGYQTDLFTAGIEPFIQTNSGEGSKTFGMSIFARGSIIENQLNAFARLDLFDPDTEVTDDGYKETFVLAGLDYTPVKNVHIIPNIWLNSYHEKDDAVIEHESDLVGRITFWFKF